MDEQQENMWTKTGDQLAAARIMLTALKAAQAAWFAGNPGTMWMIKQAIAQAERVGITTGEDYPHE